MTRPLRIVDFRSDREPDVIPAVGWSQLYRDLSTAGSDNAWKQGEHIAAIAPTGAGKTTLFKNLMPLRGHNIMFGTKAYDPLYNEIIAQRGYKRIESIDDIGPLANNYLLWPRRRDTVKHTVEAQRKAFEHAIDVIARHGGWTIWLDEVKYMAQMLGLGQQVTYMLEQFRSINATIICGAQRPAWLPLSVLANSTHVFLWKSTNRDDAKRLADVGGVDAKAVAERARMLGKHEFIYVSTRGTSARAVRSEIGKG